jgi:hypothetical protein
VGKGQFRRVSDVRLLLLLLSPSMLILKQLSQPPHLQLVDDLLPLEQFFLVPLKLIVLFLLLPLRVSLFLPLHEPIAVSRPLFLIRQFIPGVFRIVPPYMRIPHLHLTEIPRFID